MEKRRKDTPIKPLEEIRGWLGRYRKLVQSANTAAVLK